MSNKSKLKHKLEQWENEGYDVSALRAKWYKELYSSRFTTKLFMILSIGILMTFAIGIGLVVLWPSSDSDGTPYASEVPTTTAADTQSEYCSTGCLWSYVGDGFCDSSCYNSACNWDSGDCSAPTETAAQTAVTTPTQQPIATASLSPTPTLVYLSNCEHDKNEIQIALDAYYEDNSSWPTADGLPGDIAWDELVPQYMNEMPLMDSSCDWRVGADPEGEVCIAHWC